MSHLSQENVTFPCDVATVCDVVFKSFRDSAASPSDSLASSDDESLLISSFECSPPDVLAEHEAEVDDDGDEDSDEGESLVTLPLSVAIAEFASLMSILMQPSATKQTKTHIGWQHCSRVSTSKFFFKVNQISKIIKYGGFTAVKLEKFVVFNVVESQSSIWCIGNDGYVEPLGCCW